jgi:hypothetical protein
MKHFRQFSSCFESRERNWHDIIFGRSTGVQTRIKLCKRNFSIRAHFQILTKWMLFQVNSFLVLQIFLHCNERSRTHCTSGRQYSEREREWVDKIWRVSRIYFPLWCSFLCLCLRMRDENVHRTSFSENSGSYSGLSRTLQEV